MTPVQSVRKVFRASKVLLVLQEHKAYKVIQVKLALKVFRV